MKRIKFFIIVSALYFCGCVFLIPHDYVPIHIDGSKIPLYKFKDDQGSTIKLLLDIDKAKMEFAYKEKTAGYQGAFHDMYFRDPYYLRSWINKKCPK